MSDTENQDEKDVGKAESSQDEPPVEDTLILTKMDHFKKKVLSQKEWKAYLLEKLEKQEKASGSSGASKDVGFIQRLKNFFKTPEESQFFLETETKEFINCEKQKLQEESLDKKET